MKTSIIALGVAAYAIASPLLAGEKPEKQVVTGEKQAGGTNAEDHGSPAKERIAYLGVETMPVNPIVAAQLGLELNMGLAVRRVAEASPAEKVLKEHDILTRLDDQLLIDTRQLSVLVRRRKAGDEVSLTVLRGGKEVVVKAILGEREVPKYAGRGMGPGFGVDPDGNRLFFHSETGEFPELAGPMAGDVMRLIGRDRSHWLAKPRVHVMKPRSGKGSTILDLPSGNIVFSDDAGSVELNSSDGKRELTVKNEGGEVTFQGPLNTPADHEKLPPEVADRLNALRGVELEDAGEDLDVENRVLAPPTRTAQPLPEAARGAPPGLPF